MVESLSEGAVGDLDARLSAVFHGSHCSGPVFPASIQAAEKALGLLFPPSYRRFLARYGAALAFGWEIYGLPQESSGGAEPPLWSSVVESTLRYRPLSLPADSIAISHDGCDQGYFLACSRSDPEYEGPVIEWGPANEGGKQFAASFFEFAESMSRGHGK